MIDIPGRGSAIPPGTPSNYHNGGLALHRLFADARADLDTRLRRIEQAGADHNRRLDEAIETLADMRRGLPLELRDAGQIHRPGHRRAAPELGCR